LGLGAQFGHQPGHFDPHDRRDHLEGRGVAHPGHEEHEDEHAEKAPPTARLKEPDHPQNAQHHRHEHPEGDARTAPAIRHPAGGRAAERANQRAEEDEFEHVDIGKLLLGEQWQTGRKADKAAKGAGVEPAHQPIVLALEDHRLFGKTGLGIGNVVHPEPRQQRAGDDERHPDEARVLEPQLAAFGGLLRCAAQRAEHACHDHQRHRELHHRHAEIAQPGVQRQRIALLCLGEEEADVRHRRGEIAPAKPA